MRWRRFRSGFRREAAIIACIAAVATAGAWIVAASCSLKREREDVTQGGSMFVRLLSAPGSPCAEDLDGMLRLINEKVIPLVR